MDKELPTYYRYLDPWWKENRHLFFEGMSCNGIRHLVFDAVSFALTLLRNDLVIMAEKGSNSNVEYTCPSYVRGKGLCILICDVPEALRSVLEFGNHRVTAAVRDIFTVFDALLLSRKWGVQFPINVEGCVMVPYEQYMEFESAVDRGHEFPYFKQYALKRIGLIDEVLGIIHDLGTR